MSTSSQSHNIPAWAAEAVAGLPPLATQKEVAALLRLSPRTLARRIACGAIPIVSVGERSNLIARQAVAEYLAARGGAS